MTLLLYPRRSALLGAALWIGLAITDYGGLFNFGLLPLLFLLAPLVIVPLGLSVSRNASLDQGRDSTFRVAVTLQPFGAFSAVVSFLLPPGRVAGLFAAFWLLVCFLLTLCGLSQFTRGTLRGLSRSVAGFALLYLVIGGTWLVASRLGLNPMGFAEPIVLLTAVHFHFAGFAAPILLLALSRAIPASSFLRTLLLRFVAPLVLAGPAAMAVGFLVGPRAKLVAALAVALGECGLALSTLAVLPQIASLSARTLLGFSSACALLGMTLASLWAVGEYPLQPFLDLTRMVQVHGVINSFGFVLCGVVGWVLAFPLASDSAGVQP